ncbi:exported hypothetical protein [Arthrobacter sp. 9V]|nr:exported hypothetical protein [Arthrobacter sp. 9V]
MRPKASRRASTKAAGAVAPSADLTGSPGIRWIMRKDALTSTQMETTKRPILRAAKPVHGLLIATATTLGAVLKFSTPAFWVSWTSHETGDLYYVAHISGGRWPFGPCISPWIVGMDKSAG